MFATPAVQTKRLSWSWGVASWCWHCDVHRGVSLLQRTFNSLVEAFEMKNEWCGDFTVTHMPLFAFRAHFRDEVALCRRRELSLRPTTVMVYGGMTAGGTQLNAAFSDPVQLDVESHWRRPRCWATAARVMPIIFSEDVDINTLSECPRLKQATNTATTATATPTTTTTTTIIQSGEAPF